ncbi:MAG: exonuclease domain-containing protein [Lachnospiraceae bacterium]|nr:exonuclease domain-containing protein [Lachnospiraceae bacterium]
MNYIVMDLEWNQGNPEKEPELADMPFEIVEIGAIKLNKDRKMVEQFSELVKPQVYHELHHITRKLIHLQMEELQKGRVFPEVCKQFLDWCGEEEYVFCTWGPLDLGELQKNMDHYDMEPLTDRPLKFLDVQKLFSLAFDDQKTRRTLEHAVDMLEIEKDIPFHRAFSDAYYTAKVLEKIDREEILRFYSYDTYVKPQSPETEIHADFGTYVKYISRVFPDKQTALEDREVTGCRCFKCHKNIKRKVRWFTANGKHYYAVSECDVHGFMKGKIRIRKTPDDQVYVIKTEKFITAEEAKEWKDLAEKSKKQRREKLQKRRGLLDSILRPME